MALLTQKTFSNLKMLMQLPFLVCALVTTVSAIVSLGFSLVAVWKSSGSEQTAALYTLARSIALALAAFVPAMTGSVRLAQGGRYLHGPCTSR